MPLLPIPSFNLILVRIASPHGADRLQLWIALPKEASMILFSVPPLNPLQLQPPAHGGATQPASTSVTSQSSGPSDPKQKKRGEQRDQAGRHLAERGATATPAAAPKHSAPLSQRLEEEKTNQHNPVRRFFNSRPVTVGTRVLGLGLSRASERPQTSGIASHPVAAPRDKREETAALRASAAELHKRVDKIMDSTLERLPDVNHRPGRPGWREKAMRHWPLSMFAATRVGDLISKDPAYRLADPAGSKDKVATPPNLNARRRRLLERTAELKIQMDGVQEEYDMQMALHAHDEDGGRHADVLKAGAKLEEVFNELRASVKIGEHLDYYNNALATDLVESKVSFVQEQIRQLDQQLHHGGLGATDKLEALKGKRDNLHLAATLARVSLHSAQMELARIHGVKSELEARREKLQTGEAGAAERSALAKELETLDELLKELNQTMVSCREQKALTREAYDEFLPVFGAEQMKLDLTLGGKIAESARAMDERAAIWQKRAKAAWDDEKKLGKESLNLQIEAAPGFETTALISEGGRALRFALAKAAAKLKQDDPTAEREVPAQARLEILSRAVAQVCDGDVRRAASVLDALVSHPSEHWMPLPASAKSTETSEAAAGAPPTKAPTYEAPGDDLKKLFHCMATLPRGMEILNEAGADAENPKLGRAPMAALHAYWMADAHQPATAQPDDWLSKAQKMACYEVRNKPKETPLFDSGALADEVRIAYRGVCRGFLSNGPDSDYARVNATLGKVGKQWLEHAQDTRGDWAKAAVSTFFNSKQSRATPFDPKALRVTLSHLETQGIPSVKTHAHDSVAAKARELSAKLATGWLAAQAPDAKNVHRLQVAAQALCDYIAHHDDSNKDLKEMEGGVSRSQFHRTRRLYKSRLKDKDLLQLRSMVGAKNFSAETLPEFPDEFNAIFQGDGSTPEAALKSLSTIFEKTTGSAEVKKYMSDLQLDELHNKTDTARRKQLNNADDVLAFFRPMLEELRLRNQLVMTAGSEVGVGIPLLPWVPVAPATLSMNANVWSQKNEAQFQIKSPTYGVEFVISDIDTRSHDIKVSAGMGVSVGRFKAVAPNGALKLEGGKAETSFTVLRILRGKDDDGVRDEKGAREASLAVLETLLRSPSDQFKGPLDEILLKHPDVIIGWGKKENATLQGTAELGAVLRVKAHDNVAVGGSLGLTSKVERAQERSDERSGYAHQAVHDRSDQRKQRITAAGTVGMLGSYKQALHPDQKGDADRKGAWNAGGAANALEVSRDLLLRLEKNGATRFSIGDQTGGSTDRAFANASMLLAEIEDNKEEFYLRFLETVPGKKGEPRDTPANRALAESTLRQFMEDLKRAGSNPNLQFNLKYEMQPRMSGWVDALRALETLARNSGNHEAAEDYRRTLHDLLQQRSTWAFKNCAIRSKGKDSADVGWDWLIRLMARRSAETSVAVTAYPA